MADPWTASFRTPSPGAYSSDNDRPETPVYARLSRDAELARELDLASRDDTAVFKPTPFTIAKANSHYAAVAAEKKALYRKTSNSSSSSGNTTNKPTRGPIPAAPDEVAPTTVDEVKRKGPVPVIGADALSKKPAEKNGWNKNSVWMTAKNVYIPASAPPPKEPTARGRPKKKGEEEVKEAKEPKTGTPPLSKLESLLKGIDEQVIARHAEETTVKGKKGKAKAKPRAAVKRKKGSDDDGEEEAPKPKRGGRKKKVEKEEDKMTFGRIPAGATADSDFPIMQSLAKQKKLPTKTTSKSTKTPKIAAPKAKTAPKAKASKKKPITTLSFLSDSSHGDVISSLSLSNLFPGSAEDIKKPGSKKIDIITSAEDAEEVDELLNSDDDDHAPPEEEREGKKAVFSKFFGTSLSASTKVDSAPSTTKEVPPTPGEGQETQDAPSNITHVNFTFQEKQDQESPNKAADTSSSQLPYSSPLAAKTGSTKPPTHGGLEILKPKPVRQKEVDELAALAEMDGEKVEQVLRAQRIIAQRLAENSKGKVGQSFTLPDPPKAQEAGRNSPDSRSPPSARKPGFSQGGVFASQQVRSDGVASALGKHLREPYSHSSFETGKQRGRLSKWAAKPSYAGTHRVHPLPQGWNRTESHFQGGQTPLKPHHQMRSDSPPPVAVPVGGPQYQLTQLWTPSAPVPAAPRDTYRIETSQGSRYGAAAVPQPNPFGVALTATRNANGQPRFRVPPPRQQDVQLPRHFNIYRQNHVDHESPEEQDGNWEDQWKKQTGGFPVQPRVQPVPRLSGMEEEAPQQRVYFAPEVQTQPRFATHNQARMNGFVAPAPVSQNRFASRGNATHRIF